MFWSQTKNIGYTGCNEAITFKNQADMSSRPVAYSKAVTVKLSILYAETGKKRHGNWCNTMIKIKVFNKILPMDSWSLR